MRFYNLGMGVVEFRVEFERRWLYFYKQASLLALEGEATSKRWSTIRKKHIDQGLGSGFQFL
jgi:hypothetical protein